MATLKKKFDSIENSAFTLLGRLLNADTGTPLHAADFASFRLEVWDVSNAETPTLVIPAAAGGGYTGDDLDPAVVVLPALNTSSLLNRDTSGHNFRVDLDGSYIPEGNHTYSIEILATPAVGNARYLLWETKPIPVYSE